MMRLRRGHATLRFSMRVKLALVILSLLALAFAGACGSDDGDNDSPTPTSDALGQPTSDGIEPAGEPGPDAPTVSIDTTQIVVGEQGEAVLAILNFDSPGLGAWTVDIEYDNSVVSVIDCESLQGSNVCNDAFTDNTIRIAGASASGLEGDSVIGRITFQCDVFGESNLDLFIETLADGTLGEPQIVVPIIEHGAISCTE